MKRTPEVSNAYRRISPQSPPRRAIQSVAAKLMNLMNLAKVAKMTGAGAMATFGYSVSPRRDRLGLTCQRRGRTVPASRAVTKERTATNASATRNPA